jgi:hypothetical protein
LETKQSQQVVESAATSDISSKRRFLPTRNEAVLFGSCLAGVGLCLDSIVNSSSIAGYLALPSSFGVIYACFQDKNLREEFKGFQNAVKKTLGESVTRAAFGPFYLEA